MFSKPSRVASTRRLAPLFQMRQTSLGQTRDRRGTVKQQHKNVPRWKQMYPHMENNVAQYWTKTNVSTTKKPVCGFSCMPWWKWRGLCILQVAWQTPFAYWFADNQLVWTGYFTFMINISTGKNRTYSNWWIPTSFPYRSLETVDDNIDRSSHLFCREMSPGTCVDGWREKSKPLGSSPAAQALLPEQWRLWGSLCVEALTGPSLDPRCWLPPAALHRGRQVSTNH